MGNDYHLQQRQHRFYQFGACFRNFALVPQPTASRGRGQARPPLNTGVRRYDVWGKCIRRPEVVIKPLYL